MRSLVSLSGFDVLSASPALVVFRLILRTRNTIPTKQRSKNTATTMTISRAFVEAGEVDLAQGYAAAVHEALAADTGQEADLLVEITSLLPLVGLVFSHR